LSLQDFSVYLISKIDDPQWRNIFEACIPLSKRSFDFLQVLLPYFVYYSLRFTNSGDELVEVIGRFVNELFDSDDLVGIQIFLKMFDFFSCAMEQDKQIFKDFIEKETKFKYVEKLFFLDLNQNTHDQNIINFARIVNGQDLIRQSFLVVKRTN